MKSIKLDKILQEWEVDCRIDQLKLEDASMKTPELHAKYLEAYAYARIKYRESQNKEKKLLKDKWLWFNGKLEKSKIDEYNWPYDPFGGLKVLKSEFDKWLEADKDLQDAGDRIIYYKTSMDTLKEILEHIKWRSNTIKNVLDNRKFESGY